MFFVFLNHDLNSNHDSNFSTKWCSRTTKCPQQSCTCGKGVVDTVEGDGVDRVNVLDSLLLQSVAFEGVLLLLNFLARVQVLHGDAAFDRTQDVALEPGRNYEVTASPLKNKNKTQSSLSETQCPAESQAPSQVRPANHIFRYKSHLFVGEGSDTPRLILETGFPPLLNVAHIPQIPHQDTPPSGADDQPISSHRQRVDLSQR